MKEERDYGIDALRIVSMLMIVMGHVLRFGGIITNNELSSAKYFMVWFLEAACFVAVNCYALISGYVGVEKQPKLSALMTMWLQVAGYSVALVILMELLVPQRVNMSDWVTGLTPVINRKYWYFSAYFILFFMMPMLNEMLLKASKKMLRKAITTTLILSVLLTSIAKWDVFEFVGGRSLIWLVLLYILGGYLKLYGAEEKWYRKLCQNGLWVYLGCAVGMACLNSVFIRNGIALPLDIKLSHGYDLYSNMSMPVFLGSVALFAFFSVRDPGKRMCKAISILSPATFGVYIIHMQPNVWEICLTDRYAWVTEFGVVRMSLGIFGISVLIYAVCTVIDLVRLMVFRILRVRDICQLMVNLFDGMIVKINR